MECLILQATSVFTCFFVHKYRHECTENKSNIILKYSPDKPMKLNEDMEIMLLDLTYLRVQECKK